MLTQPRSSSHSGLCFVFISPNTLGMWAGGIFTSVLYVYLFSLFNKLGTMMHMGYIKGLKIFLTSSNTRNCSHYISLVCLSAPLWAFQPPFLSSPQFQHVVKALARVTLFPGSSLVRKNSWLYFWKCSQLWKLRSFFLSFSADGPFVRSLSFLRPV